MGDEPICKFHLSYAYGCENQLLLEVTYWDEIQNDAITAEIEYKIEEQYFDYSDFYLPKYVCKQIRNNESKLLEVAQQLEVGQKFVDGLIMEDEDFPFIEQEKIDSLFEQCKYIHCDCDHAFIYFSFAATNQIDDELWVEGLKNPIISIDVSLWWKDMFEQNKCNSEKMTIEIDLDGQKFIGGIYSHMPEQKYKAYFDSKVEEAFPRMIKAYENYKNRSRFQKLFKGE
ncbi:hypothetical protein AT258_18805 [Bacillus wiedmannii]|nr:hypothetical protein [Bacillus cereus]EEK75913.1 hypothetical protein bcere0009_52200 [Bacillus cereus R309803]KXY71950.1 hypothetical protein AT258_18805 [Bacillus wiedmannii]HDR4563384.1 hypothetical protein [Bacillus luti]KYQ02984.1 hypothetical protein B4079_1860 [Bacillus cereus]MBL3852745.1 hypothetical protein [Bacillus cereus]